MTDILRGLPESLIDFDWPAYLSSRGIVPPPSATAEYLGGGVSAEVVRYGDLVIKRPRTRLAVEREWNADTVRVVTEAKVMQRVRDIAPPVVDFNEDERILIMGLVAGIEWKSVLLAGEADPELFAELGISLRRIHRLDPEDLDGGPEFEELRLVPYFDVAAAQSTRYAREMVDVRERLAQKRTHVVHGDFSPKNILVRTSGGLPRTTILDWEVAHRGDPSFDIAFLATHIIAKSVYLPASAEALLNGMPEFYHAYGSMDTEWVSQLTGALLIARLYGASPLEYLNSTHLDRIESVAESLLNGSLMLHDFH